MVFPIGTPNDTFAKCFIWQSYLAPLSTNQVGIYNVTFEPGCRNNWHTHHANSGRGTLRYVASPDCAQNRKGIAKRHAALKPRGRPSYSELFT